LFITGSVKKNSAKKIKKTCSFPYIFDSINWTI